VVKSEIYFNRRKTVDYLIIGYPHGFGGHYVEFGKVTANSKDDALNKIHKSIWYEYYATEFNQEEYEKLKNTKQIEITQMFK
jgi:hypothetical protein